MTGLSPAARRLVDEAFADLGPMPIVDCHAHVVGLGSGGSGAAVKPSLLTWRHPVQRVKAGVFVRASGTGDFGSFDRDYVEKLVRQARDFGRPVKLHILAMDHRYRPDGSIDGEGPEFYVPNELVVRLAREYPDVFVPVISVHPDRPGALAELEKWAGQGVRYVKWLPNVQGMDPSDPRHDDFYRLMRKHGMILLSHTGDEKAAAPGANQALGNPLLVRRPLDLGVKVIMAHCASSGRSADLDHPGKKADNFELFLRMMAEHRYLGLLYADISAATLANRGSRTMLELIRRPELHGRLIQGSDYPLPAINCLIWMRPFVKAGMISKEERQALNEIYKSNPLLFDLVLKRTLRDPVTGERLPGGIFTADPGLSAPPAEASPASGSPAPAG
ncbi:MAG TPA: amidohydrolase family protein [Planctomycetota bacterium]|nr:amidohydrolase family protein [Planctomycetota bacterium]